MDANDPMVDQVRATLAEALAAVTAWEIDPTPSTVHERAFVRSMTGLVKLGHSLMERADAGNASR